MKIHIIDDQGYSLEALKIYKSLGKVTFGKVIRPDTDILIVRLNPVTAKGIDMMPNLKIVASSTTGLDHIDVDYARQKGIHVVSFKGRTDLISQISSTAEHTWGLILALVRNYPRHFVSEDRILGHELQGKTLGIIGYGRVGQMVARYASAFKMHVLVNDPYNNDDDVVKYSINRIFLESDIVTVHVPLNPLTKGMIKFEYFNRLKDPFYFVNTSRSQIVQKGALRRALELELLTGATSDFLEDGPPIPNLILTNHIGGHTIEGMEIAEKALAQLVKREVSKSG